MDLDDIIIMIIFGVLSIIIIIYFNYYRICNKKNKIVLNEPTYKFDDNDIDDSMNIIIKANNKKNKEEEIDLL